VCVGQGCDWEMPLIVGGGVPPVIQFFFFANPMLSRTLASPPSPPPKSTTGIGVKFVVSWPDVTTSLHVTSLRYPPLVRKELAVARCLSSPALPTRVNIFNARFCCLFSFLLSTPRACTLLDKLGRLTSSYFHFFSFLVRSHLSYFL